MRLKNSARPNLLIGSKTWAVPKSAFRETSTRGLCLPCSGKTWEKRMPDKYYLTTPLYYVNSKPHIGHSYTQIAADTLARFKRLCGAEVFFLTGTDEHGQKVQKAAEAEGLSPQAFTDRMVPVFKDLWALLGISYDQFIRTTEERHKKAVQNVWMRLNEAGQIKAQTYDGWYCTPCEEFSTEAAVIRENEKVLCPVCKRPVEQIQED